MSISVKNCLLYNIFSVFGLVLFLATSRKFFGDVIFSVCFKIDLTKGISVFRYEKKTDSNRNRSLEATPRFELGNKGFADLCLTAWLCRLKRWSGKRDSNSRPPPWQGGALPLSYFRVVCISNEYKYKTSGDFCQHLF